MNDYSELWWHKYLDCIPLYTCADCKHASHYFIGYWYPTMHPYCSVRKIPLTPDKDACNDFELIGRLGR